MRFSFPFSLRIRAMAIMGVVISLFITATLQQQITIHNHEQKDALKARVEIQANYFSYDIAQAMLDMDEKSIKNSLQHALADPDIESIVVYNNSGSLVVTSGENPFGKIKRKDDPSNPSQFLIIRDVRYNAGGKQEILGTVTFVLTTRHLEADAWDYAQRLVIAGAVVFAAFMALYYMVLGYLLYPVRKITQTMLDLAAGNTGTSIPFQQHRDEIGRMAKAIQTFRDTAVRAEELAREIGKRQQIQVELERAKELAEAANIAKSQFLANMSHEIRTPLNGVLATAELLEETPLNPKQAKYLSIIQGSGELLLSLLNDILDLSKIEAHKLKLYDEPFDILQILNMTFDLFSTSARNKGLELRITSSPDVPAWIEGDPNRLRQIMANLLSNAIKYTDRGHIEAELSVCAVDGKEFLDFRVRDTGRGIPKTAMSILFKKFEQAHKSAAIAGTGLGLAICHSLVDMMGGQIGVESEENVGSTFWFRIPLRRTPTQQYPLADASFQNYEAQYYHALVVEDVEVNQMVLTDMLEGFGCVVQVARNGQEAVDVTSSHIFDIIFMDCNMPVMDGLEATRIIRGRGDKTTPIIAVSAHAFVEDIQKCFAAGMNDFILKPVKKKELGEKIRKWGRGIPKNAAAAPSPSQAISDGDSFDPSILDQWFAEMPDKADKFIELSLKDAAGLYEAVEKAFAAREFTELGGAAHALKSVAAQIGGAALARSCKALEQIGRKDGAPGVDAAMEKCRADYAAFRDLVARAREQRRA